MLAVSYDNFVIVVVDTDTRRIVRTFRGHTNQVTDMVGDSNSLSLSLSLPPPPPLSLCHILVCTLASLLSSLSFSVSRSVLMGDGWSAQQWTVVSEHGTSQLAGKHIN